MKVLESEKGSFKWMKMAARGGRPRSEQSPRNSEVNFTISDELAIIFTIFKVDLHILVLPSMLWRPDLRFAYNNACSDSVSGGFLR